MNNNQAFNDAIKIAGVIVPIVTAIISLAGIMINNSDKLADFGAFMTSSTPGTNADKTPGTSDEAK